MRTSSCECPVDDLRVRVEEEDPIVIARVHRLETLALLAAANPRFSTATSVHGRTLSRTTSCVSSRRAASTTTTSRSRSPACVRRRVERHRAQPVGIVVRYDDYRELFPSAAAPHHVAWSTTGTAPATGGARSLTWIRWNVCGICGVVQVSGDPREVVPPDVLNRMTDAMSHRGPDDRGTYSAPGIAIGARRLSIVDVTGGHQPFSNETRRVWAAQNGEIFNHGEVRGVWNLLGIASRAVATPRSFLTCTSSTALHSQSTCAGCLALWCGTRRLGGRFSCETGSV